MRKITLIPASTIASILIFIGAGFFTLGDVAERFSNNNWVISAVFGSFFFSAIYYFAVEIYMETNDSMRTKIESAPKFEWVIRVANQTLLFSLWLLLNEDINLFCGGITFLYASFLLWNYVVRNQYKDIMLFIFDLIGLILSILFWALCVKNLHLEGVKIEEKPSEFGLFMWGGIFVFFVLNSIAASVYLFIKYKKGEKT